jgi:hypothetical protein
VYTAPTAHIVMRFNERSFSTERFSNTIFGARNALALLWQYTSMKSFRQCEMDTLT